MVIQLLKCPLDKGCLNTRNCNNVNLTSFEVRNLTRNAVCLRVQKPATLYFYSS